MQQQVEIDMLNLAKELTGKPAEHHEVLELTGELVLHRFDHDSLHILVDGGGEFVAIKDPATSLGSIIRKGHLSEFTQQ